ncbi:hypothetical protein E2C01_092695 [Portunus trituberculatus]|uniref:Uncharacterized protein n=1 Tax=Portunus trituberculatus TaxID=210409 RepID=A0A5B7JMQ7_PORTR|nr:hypothetical protein [Portunus trituberculatus]
MPCLLVWEVQASSHLLSLHLSLLDTRRSRLLSLDRTIRPICWKT